MSGVARTRTRATGRDGGFVLICVLWVLAILTIVALGFYQRSWLDARAATYSMDYAKAMQMARGAVQRGIAEVRNKEIIDWCNREEGGTGLGQAWAHPVDMLAEGIYYELGDPSEFDADICRYVIEDEERRISINSADDRLLAGVEGLRSSDVRKIVRRRTQGARREEGAQRFMTIEELRYMFRHIDEETWFGEDGEPGLRDMLTRWGGGKVNLNTASPAVLECIPDVRRGDLEAVLNFRVGPDGELGTRDDLAFNDFDELRKKVDISQRSIEAFRKYCTTRSVYFTITGVATLRRGKVRAYCQATVQGTAVVQWREGAIDS